MSEEKPEELEHSDVIGGSSAERVINCPGSYQFQKKGRDKSSSFADEGTMLHAVAENIMNGEDVKHGFEVSGHKYTQDLEWEMINPALAHFDKLEDLYGEFEYEVEPRVTIESIEGAFGSIDINGANDDYILILDWKFGRGVAVLIEGNYQLRFYALGARYKDPASFVGKKIVLAVSQPGIFDEVQIEVIDNEELDRFEAEMLESFDHDFLAEGKWCQWCKGKAECPLKTGKAQKVAKIVEDMPDPKTALSEETLDNLSNYMELIKSVEPWIKAVKAEVMDALEDGEAVPGWKLVPKQANRKWNDEELTAARLKGRKFKKDETHAAPKLKSPAQIEKMVKGHKKDTKFIGELCSSISSGNTMAPEDDKRPAVTVGGVASKLAAAALKLKA